MSRKTIFAGRLSGRRQIVRNFWGKEKKPSFFKKSEVFAAPLSRQSGDKPCWQLALCESATWNCAVVRTDTDINGQVRTINLLERCDKPYHHKPRKRRYSHPTTRLPGFSPATGAKASGLRSGALSRRYSRVLPRSPRQARTHVRNWSGDDRKARESKRERPV